MKRKLTFTVATSVARTMCEGMKKLYLIPCVCMGLALVSCSDDGPETFVSDIPGDELATENPVLEGEANVTIPNVQYSTQTEEGHAVMRLDMTGIQDKQSLEWIRLLGTAEAGQNVWLELDGTPKGIKVFNTIDDADKTVPVDLVFLVDNSGSMSEEADVIARDIVSWAERLSNSGIDIRFGCVGYDGEITGALNITTVEELDNYLTGRNRRGTYRTEGFVGNDNDVTLFYERKGSYRTGGSSSNECGMAALRFANDLFAFRRKANRVYVNFTDEPNQPAGISRFSVESLKTDWDTSYGTIHTVFSSSQSNDRYECNALMSEYTGGTVIYTNNRFTGVSLDALPVSDAMMNSYIIRFTNIDEMLDGMLHNVKITIQSPDNSIRAEKQFMINFTAPIAE